MWILWDSKTNLQSVITVERWRTVNIISVSLTSTELHLIFLLIFAVMYFFLPLSQAFGALGRNTLTFHAKLFGLSASAFIFQTDLMFVTLSCRRLYSNLLRLI